MAVLEADRGPGAVYFKATPCRAKPAPSSFSLIDIHRPFQVSLNFQGLKRSNSTHMLIQPGLSPVCLHYAQEQMQARESAAFNSSQDSKYSRAS